METKDNAHFYIVAAKGWIEKDGKFLLARRGPEELHMPGVWSLPGGKVETDTEEAHVIEKTLQNEIKEEVGIDVAQDMKLIYNNSFLRSDGHLVVGLTFICQYVGGDPQPLEDTTELAWHTLDELKQLSGIEAFLVREIQILSDALEHK